ncbi:hypothetical protein [Bradyrhizobium canariense]|uniref:hypothetical protein n=1 Tax=Bradyrhizobium canariense TaxID=255045 RepID=UPI0019575140|nr:hypothetical protein [Bradyrhizobium canariense]MBM7485920.1 hypothetical protein [Bradyrhizobium canariense]
MERGALKNHLVDPGRLQDCDEVACPESTIMALAAEDELEALRIGKKMAAMLNQAITVRAADGRIGEAAAAKIDPSLT